MDNLNPPAIVREYAAAVEKIREARALDGVVREDIARAVHNTRVMGRLLCEAKALTPRGKWEEVFKATWPDTSLRTAREWMRVHKDNATADLNAKARAVFHAEAPPDAEEVDPHDPPADRGDADDSGEVPESWKPAPPRPAPAPQRSSSQPSLDLDPAKADAEQLIAEWREHLDAALDLARRVYRSPARRELQRLLRLSRIEVQDDGTPRDLQTLFREVSKLHSHGFEPEV